MIFLATEKILWSVPASKELTKNLLHSVIGDNQRTGWQKIQAQEKPTLEHFIESVSVLRGFIEFFASFAYRIVSSLRGRRDMQNTNQAPEIATGTEVGDTTNTAAPEVATHAEAHVPIQGPSFQTAFCNVGYRHDNGPAWNSRRDFAAFETPHGKVRVGSFPLNMYGFPFSIGDRISAQGGASVRALTEASPAPNPSNPVPRGEVYVLGTHSYHSEKAGEADGVVEVALDQALLRLLPVANAALEAGSATVTLCYTRSFAPAFQHSLPHDAEVGLAERVKTAIDAAWAALPKVAEEPSEHPLLPGVKIPPDLSRVLDARGLREISRCLWEGKGGSEVNAWADSLNGDQLDWVAAQFTPHSKVFDDAREEWEGLKQKWSGKLFPAAA